MYFYAVCVSVCYTFEPRHTNFILVWWDIWTISRSLGQGQGHFGKMGFLNCWTPHFLLWPSYARIWSLWSRSFWGQGNSRIKLQVFLLSRSGRWAFDWMHDFLCLNYVVIIQELSLRRWSSVQARDFGALHATLATLILNSDVSPHRTECKYHTCMC